ncbi:MAG: hypothetical protein ACD_75C00482G0003 [uncultured bacterium]|nr:MAG: hypothetical protein ACD_75C00482G0003 [uncultured bacterium]
MRGMSTSQITRSAFDSISVLKPSSPSRASQYSSNSPTSLSVRTTCSRMAAESSITSTQLDMKSPQ